MSRVFTDGGLLTWEAFASTGPFGLPEQPAIVFQCLSDPDRRARYVRHDGNAAGAQRLVREVPEGELVHMLGESAELR
jgi:uncharacterized protein YndB with AHSA1/START domain